MRSETMFYHGKSCEMKMIVRLNLTAKLREQIDDLRLNGNVERRDRFVRDDQFRLDREGAGNGDALALAAGKFVRIFFHRRAAVNRLST